MVKLLLADDELIEREGLKAIIDKHFSKKDLMVVGEAKNGREAIEKNDQLRPDVIFLDIKMPGIDGLKAAEEIVKVNKTVKIIILTAYDYFDYAKKAIHMGAYEYLLKPARKSKIISLLDQIIEEDKEEKSKKQDYLKLQEDYYETKKIVEYRLSKIILDGSLDKDPILKKRLESLELYFSKYYVYAIKEKSKTCNIEDLLMHIESFISGEEDAILTRYDDIIYLIMFIDEDNNYYSSQDFGQRLYRYLYNRRKIDTKIGISECENFDRLKISLISARRRVNETSKDIFLKNSDVSMQVTIDSKIEETLEMIKFIETGEQKDIKAFKEYIDELLKNKDFLNLLEILILLRFNIYIKHKKIFFKKIVDQIKNNQYSESLRTHIYNEVDLYLDHMKADSQDIIPKVEKYIENKYMRNITLDSISQKFAISPYYFSKKFKDVTGRGFIDYLNQVRVDHSKELLRNNYSIKEIAKKVGYSNPNYYSRVFKKYTGVSPSQYKL